MDVTRDFEWDAAHRVLRHESRCATLHGHRYRARVTCEADVLDDVSRVVDFGTIKEKVGAWIDERWDHTTLVNAADFSLLSLVEAEAEHGGRRAPYVFHGEPTAELIAAELLGVAHRLLSDDRVRVREVQVWETPNCSAIVRR